MMFGCSLGRFRRFGTVILAAVCLALCSCSKGEVSVSEKSLAPTEQVVQTEPGHIDVPRMTQRFEEVIREGSVSGLSEGEMLPAKERGDLDAKELVSGTVLENVKLNVAYEYASGDIVLFFDPIEREKLSGVDDLLKQLADKGYAYADCIPEDAQHCIVVLSDDADRGALVKETYYKILTGMPL